MIENVTAKSGPLRTAPSPLHSAPALSSYRMFFFLVFCPARAVIYADLNMIIDVGEANTSQFRPVCVNQPEGFLSLGSGDADLPFLLALGYCIIWLP